MLDLWLTKSNKVIDEVIKETNLKDVVRAKIQEFMNSDEYNKYLISCIKSNIKQNVEEYCDNPFRDRNEFDNIVDEVMKKINKAIKR